LSLFQNPVVFGTSGGLKSDGKTGQDPRFSVKFKEAMPKTDVLDSLNYIVG
jgi:hypothetical protein